ncbi:GNAT family N-acetyltransferase [Evansella cellulosilytica]|uniref:GCN5-related N-acetyltransferase n=1 Tax=Evansella cellulosilytica (strain ATCC 21833 / DSM 2522 / FERM P-1141 / JCM 9156 / N-4) TaxID=649639 RepID=E6TYZ0_EVAC2|nr:GNAT family protein [Evansella cellulosilytica]ADU32433.1 GCN5-related N-acetyltransferase [Evansella cellulosilytica DSM 2522]
MEKQIKRLESIPLIETKNYLLREIMVEDASSLYSFLKEKNTMKYITPHPVKTIEEVKENIIGSLQQFEKTKEVPWVIVNKMNEEIVGTFRFHKLNLWHKKTEMGVVIRKEYQQTGVMTEILSYILQFGFEVMKLNRIVGDIFAENKGSKKLLEKYGFHKDGVLRQTDFDGEKYHDTVVYSLLRDEYYHAFNSEKRTTT